MTQKFAACVAMHLGVTQVLIAQALLPLRRIGCSALMPGQLADVGFEINRATRVSMSRTLVRCWSSLARSSLPSWPIRSP